MSWRWENRGGSASGPHCGIEWLGKFNGEQWLLEGNTSNEEVPAEWMPYMDPTVDEEIVLRLELTDEGTITARPDGAPTDESVTYEKTSEPNPGCD